MIDGPPPSKALKTVQLRQQGMTLTENLVLAGPLVSMYAPAPPALP